MDEIELAQLVERIAKHEAATRGARTFWLEPPERFSAREAEIANAELRRRGLNSTVTPGRITQLR